MSADLGMSAEIMLEKQYPLHKACREGNQEIVNSLLSNNQYDLYEEDGYFGWTPIHWASYFGKLECLMKLIEYGCNSDAVTMRLNQSPLHVAALGGNVHCLKSLIHYGASLNRQDYLGDTPVHKAARAGNMECLGFLIEQNAALDIRNYNGQTASEIAKTALHSHCADYLEKAMEFKQQGQLTLSNGSSGINSANSLSNGHCASMEDCDMEMDTSPNLVSNDHQMTIVENKCSLNMDITMNGTSVNNSVFRAFNGVKRSIDEDEECHIKRPCMRSTTPQIHISPKTSSESIRSSPESLSQSAVEHSLSLQEQTVYNSLLASSIEHR